MIEVSDMKHIFIILLAIAIIAGSIFLPYVPGDYDSFAVGLSYIFQFTSFASLLLVPLGIIRLIRDVIGKSNKQTVKNPRYFKRTVLIVTVIIILAAALGAFASNSRFAAILILGTGIFLFLFRRKVISFFLIPSNMLPYYFIFIPLTVIFIRLIFLKDVKNKATAFVIQQSEQLIQDIEAFKITNGYYPVSLLSTIEDYKPRISGVPRFHYERNGNAYNIYFEQTSELLGTEEVVMYNKLGEHEMTVHNQDLLRIAPENILRGYHRETYLSQPHWKIFYFD
jgi:hypothetical protein